MNCLSLKESLALTSVMDTVSYRVIVLLLILPVLAFWSRTLKAVPLYLRSV